MFGSSDGRKSIPGLAPSLVPNTRNMGAWCWCGGGQAKQNRSNAEVATHRKESEKRPDGGTYQDRDLSNETLASCATL